MEACVDDIFTRIVHGVKVVRECAKSIAILVDPQYCQLVRKVNTYRSSVILRMILVNLHGIGLEKLHP